VPALHPELDELATKLFRVVSDLRFQMHQHANAGVLTMQTWVLSDLAEELHVQLGRIPSEERCVIRDDMADDELPSGHGPGLSSRPSSVSPLNRHPTTQRAVVRRRADQAEQRRAARARFRAQPAPPRP
jgi:hypothetical protein